MIFAISKKVRDSNVALKLDMAKAYDKVTLVFLTSVLRAFGFGEIFIDMVWRLVSNCYFSVLVNGQPCGFFKSARGFRQGGPLLPVLFIISAVVLSRGLNALLVEHHFIPFFVDSNTAPVTHLAYADDISIFP